MERLIFSVPEHLQEAREFAKRTQQTDKLDAVLDRLLCLAESCHARAWISPDFVPYSFYFQLYPELMESIPDDWQKYRIMNGGVIYHGSLDDGTHPETFAVTLTRENSWSIHT